jgi:hypothetical protein
MRASVQSSFKERTAVVLRTERRKAERLACDLEGFYRPLGASPAGLWWLAGVRDLSVKGIGLILTRRLEPGTLLSVELQNAAETYQRTILARIVHVQETEDGSWRVGGMFISRLQEEELQALLS